MALARAALVVAVPTLASVDFLCAPRQGFPHEVRKPFPPSPLLFFEQIFYAALPTLAPLRLCAGRVQPLRRRLLGRSAGARVAGDHGGLDRHRERPHTGDPIDSLHFFWVSSVFHGHLCGWVAPASAGGRAPQGKAAAQSMPDMLAMLAHCYLHSLRLCASAGVARVQMHCTRYVCVCRGLRVGTSC